MNAPAAYCQFLTPPGAGAIAVIRLTGDRAWDLLRGLIRRPTGELPAAPDPSRLYFGQFIVDGEALDEVVVAGWTGSGRQTADISCHGGLRVAERVLAALILAGARHAPPPPADDWPTGLDRSIDDCVARARTGAAVRFLLRQRPLLHAAVEELLSVALTAGVDPAQAGLAALLDRWPGAVHYADPARVVLVGPPNVGKSLLANRLAGRQRAVVADRAGTTRDWVVLPAAWDGLPIQLIDTAGLRAGEEDLENEAMRRGLIQVKDAHLQLLVLDRTAPPDQLDDWTRLLSSDRLVVAWNKQDLPVTGSAERPTMGSRVPVVATSAVSGIGLDDLRVAIHARLAVPPADCGDPVVVDSALRARLLSLRRTGTGMTVVEWSDQLVAALCGHKPGEPGFGEQGGI